MATIDSYTKLLLHLDGNDGATSFPDVSGSGHTFTGVGTAQIDTAKYRFGCSSLLLDGNSDYIYSLDSDDWNVGSNPFMFDLWFIVNSYNAAGILFAQASNTVDNNQGFYCYISSSALRFRYTNDGKWSGEITWAVNHSLAVNSLTHLAIGRNNNIGYIFINGIKNTFDATGMNVFNSTLNFTIGQTADAFYDYFYFNGWIDEFRLSKGICRWTDNFLPPTRAYGSKRQKVILI